MMLIRWVVAAGALATLAGCVVDPYASYAGNGRCQAVPQLAAAPAPLPPVSSTPLVLQPAHWDWTGSNYVAVPPTWVPPPPRGSQWQAGYWTVGAGGGCAWVSGGWV